MGSEELANRKEEGLLQVNHDAGAVLDSDRATPGADSDPRVRELAYLKAELEAARQALVCERQRAVRQSALHDELEGKRSIRIARLVARGKTLKRRLAVQRQRAEAAEHVVRKLKSSSSWRVSAPLRELVRTWRRFSRMLKRLAVRRPAPRPDVEPCRQEGNLQRDVGRENAPPRMVRKRYADWDHETERAFLAWIDKAYSSSPRRYDRTKASIVLPTYNRADVIGTAIDSVIAQSHADWELLIIDDGSKDATAEVVQPYLADPRISYVETPHNGVSSARNRGLERARGEIVFYIDSDNWWKSNFLRTMIVFMKSEKLVSAYSGLELLDDNGAVTDFRGDKFDWRACYRENFIDMNCFAHMAMPASGAQVKFDESLKRLVDWDFILRMSLVGRIAYAPFVGVGYYAGARGQRITQTRFQNGGIKKLRRAIRKKHDSEKIDHRDAMIDIDWTEAGAARSEGV